MNAPTDYGYKPLCGKVKPENILDDILATDPSAPSTCEVCQARDPRSREGIEWGIWDADRSAWMPNPSRMPVDPSPARYKSREEAEAAAERNWRTLNPNDTFLSKPF